MFNVPASLSNFKTKTEQLDFDKWKTVPINLKNLSGVVSKEVIKNTEFNKLNTKINYSEKATPAAINLIHINQYNVDKHNLEKKVDDFDKKKNTRR